MENKYSQRNLDEIKKDIDLIAYAESKGYQMDKYKSTSKHINLFRTEGDGNKDTIIVYRDNKSGHDGYFNPNDTRDKGNVIDFERYRNKEGWKGTFQALDHYLGTAPQMHKPPVERQAEPEPPKREKVINNDFQFQPLKNTAYLESRGLKKETIEAPEFKDRVFNKPFKDENGKEYINTAFPLRNEQGTVAAIVRNSTVKVIENERADSVWLSNTNHKLGKVDKLVITENPIDGMSYHQLKPPADDEKRVYMGTAGALSNGQQRLIQVVNDKLEPRQIVLANDNDTGGFKNNIKIIGGLRHKDAPESYQVQVALNQSTKSNVILLISVSHSSEKEGQDKVKSIGDRFREAISKDTPKGVEADLSVKVNVQGKNQSEIEVHFANNRENLRQAQRVTVQIKGLEQVVKMEQSISKDFSEDVQKGVKYGLDKTEKAVLQPAGDKVKTPIGMLPTSNTDPGTKGNGEKMGEDKASEKMAVPRNPVIGVQASASTSATEPIMMQKKR